MTPKRHGLSEHQPSKTDAKRMLELFLQAELKGRSNEELKTYAKSCLKLALAVHHRRTATITDAAIAIESVNALTAIFSLLTSRQDDWLNKSRWKKRDDADREFLSLLLVHAIINHPVIRMAKIQTTGFNFSDTNLKLNVSARGQVEEVFIEKYNWWKPASAQNAQHLADELALRALSVLPAIDSMSLTE